MDLKLEERLQDGYLVVELSGELDSSNADGLRDWLLNIPAERASRLILDLSRLVFIDSTGVGVLAAAEQRARELGGTVSLAGPQKIVANVLHVTGLDKQFSISPSVGDALAAGREKGPPLTGA